MKIIKVKNYEELSKKAAELIIEQVRKKPNSVLGLATGETPLGAYKEIIKAYRQKKVSFAKVKTFNLDEYWPISRKNKNSFYYTMFKNFLSKIDIQKKNVHILNSESINPAAECNNYSKLLSKNRIDLQILGIGVNGHVGFNEPESSFNSKTRLIKLTESTIKRNSRLFKDKNKIPKKALTMGMSEIMKAKRIILLASGKPKKPIISKLIKIKPTEKIPASVIKKHKNSILIVDEKAFA